MIYGQNRRRAQGTIITTQVWFVCFIKPELLLVINLTSYVLFCPDFQFGATGGTTRRKEGNEAYEAQTSHLISKASYSSNQHVGCKRYERLLDAAQSAKSGLFAVNHFLGLSVLHRVVSFGN